MTFLIPDPIRDVAYGLYAYATFDRTNEASVVQAQAAIQQAFLSAQRTALAAASCFALLRSFSPETPVAISFAILGATFALSFSAGGIATGGVLLDVSRDSVQAVHSFALKSFEDRMNALAAIVSFGAGLWTFNSINTISILDDWNFLNILEKPMASLASSLAESVVKHRPTCLPPCIASLKGLLSIGKWNQLDDRVAIQADVAEAIGTIERVALATAALFAYRAAQTRAQILSLPIGMTLLSPCSALMFTGLGCLEYAYTYRTYRVALLAWSYLQLWIIPSLQKNPAPGLLDGFIKRSSEKIALWLVPNPLPERRA